MKQIACALIVASTVAVAIPAWGMPQGTRPEELMPHPAQAAGLSLAAAMMNVVYFPVRLAVTAVTAEAGGLTAWLTGGDKASARSIWNATDGQAYVTPAMLEGRERLRFGTQPQ